MSNRKTLASWKKLQQQANDKKSEHMNVLFANDDEHFDKFSIELPAFLFDYSKNLIDKETMVNLLELAEDSNVCEWREKMFSGERINKT